MTTRTYYVTPSLLVGDLPPRVPTCVRAASATEALDWIGAGRIAVLPHEHWADVRSVLLTHRMSESEIVECLTYANPEAG